MTMEKELPGTSIKKSSFVPDVKTLFDNESKNARGANRHSIILDWEKAQELGEFRGRKRISVPINRDLSGKVNTDLSVERFLVIDYSNNIEGLTGSIVSIITPRGESTILNSALLRYDDDEIPGFDGKVLFTPYHYNDYKGGVYKKGRKFAELKILNKVSDSSSDKGRVSTENLQCWERWLITYYSDGTVTEVFLDIVCVDINDSEAPEEAGGGSSGPGPGPEENLCQNINPSDFDVIPENLITASGVSGETSTDRNWSASWKVATALLYSVSVSLEGKHQKTVDPLNPWKWESLAVTNAFKSGVVLVGTVTPTVLSSAINFDYTNAHVNVNVNINSHIVCQGITLFDYDQSVQSSKTFHVND